MIPPSLAVNFLQFPRYTVLATSDPLRSPYKFHSPPRR